MESLRLTRAAFVAGLAFLGLTPSRPVRRRSRLMTMAAIVITLSAAPGSAAAETRKNAQSGQVGIDLSTESSNPYADSEAAALGFLKDIKEAALASATSKPLIPSDAAVHFMTGFYLFCSIRAGVCSAPLDSLLLADRLNNALNPDQKCTVLKRFWTHYLENDFEKRHRYATQTAFLTQTQDFNSKFRPRYIECDKTVAAMKGQKIGESDIKALDKVIAGIEQVKAHDVDVFVATGAQN